MKKMLPTIGLIFAVGLALAAPARAFPQASPDEKLFQDAKLLIFDKKWESALGKLQELTDSYAHSPYYGQAVFYEGECLSSLKGREAEALKTYKEYLGLPGANAGLVEEAEGSIIDLAYALYEKGDKTAVRDIEERLTHPDKAVRFYAAYKLSMVSDRAVALKAVPVLKRTIETEKEADLADRARIALLRISPESLKTVEDSGPAQNENRVLRIRVWKKGQKAPQVSISIPWSLADLALGAMSEQDKAAMRAKGYDISRILSDLAKSKQKLFRLEADDGTIFEIWIE
jgi:hypothetical protein